MSYILPDDGSFDRGPNRASSDLKGFFGFAFVALVAVNLGFGLFGVDLNQAWQLAASLAGGLGGIVISRFGRTRTSHE